MTKEECKQVAVDLNGMNLATYVQEHAVRGACTCGACIDAPPNPDSQQPDGHTVNLTFFEVAAEAGNPEEFLSLVREEHPGWLDGAEHNYLDVGAEMGDQDLALMTIGLGHLLGVWKALSPDTIMPEMPDDLKTQMAGMGMVALQAV